MKLIVVLLLFPSLCFADDWSRGDTYRQTAVTLLLIADWRQTLQIAKHPEQNYEQSPILGDHPSVGKVNNFFAAHVLGHAAISYILPQDLRHAWQYVWIGVEFNQVRRNYQVGLKIGF